MFTGDFSTPFASKNWPLIITKNIPAGKKKIFLSAGLLAETGTETDLPDSAPSITGTVSLKQDVSRHQTPTGQLNGKHTIRNQQITVLIQRWSQIVDVILTSQEHAAQPDFSPKSHWIDRPV
jgi:hypothetical protein